MEVAAILKIRWAFLLGDSEKDETAFEENLMVLSDKKERYITATHKNKAIDIEKEISLLKEEIGKLKKKGK